MTCEGMEEAACKENYVGETERTLQVKVKEHRRPSCTSPEVTRRILQEDPGHSFDLDSAQNLDRESDWFKRRDQRGNLH